LASLSARRRPNVRKFVHDALSFSNGSDANSTRPKCKVTTRPEQTSTRSSTGDVGKKKVVFDITRGRTKTFKTVGDKTKPQCGDSDVDLLACESGVGSVAGPGASCGVVQEESELGSSFRQTTTDGAGGDAKNKDSSSKKKRKWRDHTADCDSKTPHLGKVRRFGLFSRNFVTVPDTISKQLTRKQYFCVTV